MITVISVTFLCLLPLKSTSQEDVTCETKTSDFYQIKWPTSNTTTVSQPVCLNENREFSYRDCINGQWSPEPKCSFVQIKTLPECPEGFTDAECFCYMMSPKSQFPPLCSFKDVIPFAAYQHIIEEPVWMPVKRNLDNGLGVFQWLDASSLYKTIFNGSYIYNETIKDKDCLLYYNSTYIVATPCNETHLGICAYYKLDQLSNQLCDSSCRQSDVSATKCFCLGETSQELPKAELLMSYQNTIYSLMTNNTCAIGLQKTSKGSYVWVNSLQEINYTYWSQDTVFDDDHIYGALTPDGWILTEKPTTCALFEAEPTCLESSLSLKFDNHSTSFKLSVSNPRGLKSLKEGIKVYCFSDAWPTLLYRFTDVTIVKETENNFLYEFYPYEFTTTLDNYWCEALTYPDLEPITTTKVTTWKEEQFEFVVILSAHYSQRFIPLSQDMLDFLQNEVLYKFQNATYLHGSLYIYKLMKIVDVDEERNQVEINVRLTIIDPKEKTLQEEINNVRKSITDVLSEFSYDVTLVDFRSSRYCFSETVDNVTWPQTVAKMMTTPTSLCIVNDKKMASRLCKIDNVIDGAYWDQNPECTIPQHSALTSKLYNLLTTSRSIEQLCSYSSQVENLNAVDIYLIAETCMQIVLTNSEINQFIAILNNIMKVDRNMLLESQLKFVATDLLIYTFTNLDKINSQESTHFTIKSAQRQYLTGFIVQKFDDTFITAELIDNYTIGDIQSVDSVDSAIWLSPELRSSIAKDWVLTFAIFYTDTLFNECNGTRNATRVFTPFPIFETSSYDIDGSIIILEKINDGDKISRYCSQWNYDIYDKSGFWEDVGTMYVSSPFIMCKFSAQSHFPVAITFDRYTDQKSDNVTEILLDLLTPAALSSSSRIVRLRMTSERYNEFTSNDVYLLGEVLSTLNSAESTDLVELTQLISNVQSIERKILLQSQEENTATDLILRSVDLIIKNYNVESDVHFVAPNFMILICNSRSNISGLALLTKNETTETVILRNNVDLARYKDLECAVLLNKKLKDQMIEDTRIIITIFENDNLFNDRSLKTQKRVAKRVFGVILPEIGTYQAPITIVHNLIDTSTYQKECVYWNYNSSSNISGSWQEDASGTYNQDYTLQCDFWHTTHFALLLLDRNKYDDIYKILDIAATVNCIMSLIGLTGIFLTAIFFKDWRSNTGNQLLLNFAFAITLQIAIFYISDDIHQSSHTYLLCTVIGATLHYATIAQFFWMLIIAVLQFQRFVRVLGTRCKRIHLKAFCCGWILPLVPVLCVLIFDNDSYVHSKVGLCYPSGLGLYLGVWLPTLVVIMINFSLFVIIMKSVTCRKTSRVYVNNDESRYQLRLAVLLYFMLGITWISGFLSNLDFGEVFLYLFTFTVTLQGHVLFLFFIMFNLNTRYLYLRAIQNFCRNC